MLGRIKEGAIISQDFSVDKWPAQASGEPIDKNKVFEIEWHDSFWTCKADGYGLQEPKGRYGNGSIFVHDKNGVAPIVEITEERTKQIIAKLESDDYEHVRATIFMTGKVRVNGEYVPEELRAMADWVEKKHD